MPGPVFLCLPAPMGYPEDAFSSFIQHILIR
jgi:hypothetical protein